MKCHKCGFELGHNASFCMECGAKVPSEKQCPNCGFMTIPTAKFCMECGYRFPAPGVPGAPWNDGITIGDRNVIAGDVIAEDSPFKAKHEAVKSGPEIFIGDKNMIAGDIIGKQLKFGDHATFINNEDETKRVVQCYICKRNMAIIDSIECPRCHEFVCEHCYDREDKLCLHCKEEEFKTLERAAAQGDEKAKKRYMKALMVKLGMKTDGTLFKCYKYSEQMKEFVIPDGITEITEDAFSGADIISVEIPSSVKIIHGSAFYMCLNLQKVILHEGLETIGEHAFRECKRLLEIKIPKSVKTIGKYALFKCSNLQKVTLQEGLEMIGEHAFGECKQLSEINIPGSVMTIDENAFYECSDLQKVILHEGLETIGECAFEGCKQLSEINIPGSVMTIDRRAFCNCFSLQKVILNEGLDTIGFSAFSDCSSLSEISIPNSVKMIHDNAFFLSGIDKISIPPKTKLGDICVPNIIRSDS